MTRRAPGAVAQLLGAANAALGAAMLLRLETVVELVSDDGHRPPALSFGCWVGGSCCRA